MRANGPASPSSGGRAPTAFLPAERTAPARLAEEIATSARSPLVTAVLQASAGAAAVVDASRQLVALNAGYLELLGVDDAAAVLGLRPGEAIGCVYADGAPGGCGTTQACAACGAAIALLVAGNRGRPEQRDCALSIQRFGRRLDHVFRARAAPLALEGDPFLLLTLLDVSAESRRAALERAFLHDLANLAVGLRSAGEALRPEAADATAAEDVRALTEQLVREVRLQRALLAGKPEELRAVFQSLRPSAALDVLRRAMEHHPAAGGRTIQLDAVEEDEEVKADPTLLHHVLGNMVVNALEATPPGGRVRVAVARDGEQTCFRVWNAGAIPAAVAPRIFQRYFSTKPEAGRGQGTYAMKVFGEEYLGGAVSFTTSAAEGTWFELRLPGRGDAARLAPA